MLGEHLLNMSVKRTRSSADMENKEESASGPSNRGGGQASKNSKNRKTRDREETDRKNNDNREMDRKG